VCLRRCLELSAFPFFVVCDCFGQTNYAQFFNSLQERLKLLPTKLFQDDTCYDTFLKCPWKSLWAGCYFILKNYTKLSNLAQAVSCLTLITKMPIRIFFRTPAILKCFVVFLGFSGQITPRLMPLLLLCSKSFTINYNLVTWLYKYLVFSVIVGVVKWSV
jgi:hypothetical protein